jgi:CBS domain-containing protein
MKVADVMTVGVITVRFDASKAEALSLMRRHAIGGLPVTDENDQLCGMVTEKDLKRRARFQWRARAVSSLMSRVVLIVGAELPLAAVTEIFRSGSVGRLPVKRDGQLVGIVSRSDLLKPLAWRLAGSLEGDDHDAALRRQILTELADQPCGAQHLDIVVNDGTVEVGGIVAGEAQRQELETIVKKVPGVRDMLDQLVIRDRSLESLLVGK